MKVIIAGSRGIEAELGHELLHVGIEAARSRGIEATEIVCGKSNAGVDKCAREWAAENSLPVRTFGADYDGNRGYGGFARNEELVKHGDAIIVISLRTTGTAHLIAAAIARQLPIVLITVTGKQITVDHMPARFH